MREALLKVTLSEKSSILKEWEQHYHLDLPALLQAVKFVKMSVNEHLSHLICQNNDFVSRDQGELTENSDLEEEVKDDISGFIKHVNRMQEKPKQQEKRKMNYLNQAKKVRK